MGTRRLRWVEVVNGDDVETAVAGWPFWAAMLNRGHRLTAIGGSDEHTPDEPADNRIGRPTTVVYARELSEPALLDGLRAGRTYIRIRGMDGPSLDLAAISAEGRFGLGDVVPTGQVTLEATIGRAQGQSATWMRNGQPLQTAPIPADGKITHSLVARPGDWFSLVVRDSTGPTLFSSAIYARR